MNLLGIESSSRKLSVGLMKEQSFSELHSEKINDTANSLPALSKKIITSLDFELTKDQKKTIDEINNEIIYKKLRDQEPDLFLFALFDKRRAKWDGTKMAKTAVGSGLGLVGTASARR